MGIRPAVVALIVAPVITSAQAAKINMKTVFIPVGVALLIYSDIPYISNPILYVVLGGIFGYIYYMRKKVRAAAENNKTSLKDSGK